VEKAANAKTPPNSVTARTRFMLSTHFQMYPLAGGKAMRHH